MNVGKNFTLEEMVASETAAKEGILNVPNAGEVQALTDLVAHILDPLRELLGKPVLVNSGFRCVALNKAVGGVADSQHCLGQAADIHVPGMSIGELITYIREHNLPFDQLIDEFGEWVHVSYGPKQRREALVLRSVNGHAQYSFA